MPKCLALLSGGLDSTLAIRLMQQQGVDVEAVHFRTLFTCCQDDAGRVAHQLRVPLTVMSAHDDYFTLIRRPEFGYGRAANPCIDCRIYMFRKAKSLMEQLAADFIVSGEIIGQRPKSQKRRDLQIIAHHADLDDHLLRPLCARRLPPTWPERAGLVDRDRLHAFTGRSRKGLIELARQLGVTHIPAPSSGCQLTEPRFSRKVFDLLAHESDTDRWAFELLKYGRHYRFAPHTKIIVGRNESDNLALAQLFAQNRLAAALLQPTGFTGPVALIAGRVNDAALSAACGLILRHGKSSEDAPQWVEVRQGLDGPQRRLAQRDPAAEALVNLSLTSCDNGRRTS